MSASKRRITVVYGGTAKTARNIRRTVLHPGEILREQFMSDFGVSINRLARDLRVPPTRIGEIVNERRGISPDTALRLGRISGPALSSG